MGQEGDPKGVALRKVVTRLGKACLPATLVRQRLKRGATGKMLLTFDDGPCPDVTPRVLDLLERWNAKAVFFVPGNRVERAPHLLREILDRGHAIGNHTFRHEVLTTFRDYVEDIGRCQDLLRRETGQLPRYFRPPFGKLTLRILGAARMHRLATVRWSFDTGERSYLRTATPSRLADNLVANAVERSIVLAHDDTAKTVETLELALPQLSARGFDLAGGIRFL